MKMLLIGLIVLGGVCTTLGIIEYNAIMNIAYNFDNYVYSNGNFSFDVVITYNGFIPCSVAPHIINVYKNDDTAVLCTINSPGGDINKGSSTLTYTIDNITQYISIKDLFGVNDLKLTAQLPILVGGLQVYTYNLNYTITPQMFE